MTLAELEAWQAFAVRVFGWWPDPWIAVLCCTTGMIFGTALVQFLKVWRKAAGLRRLSVAEKKTYCGIIAAIVAAVIAQRFTIVQGDAARLLLHSLAAGLFSPWVAAVAHARLRQYSTTMADALTHAMDGDTTQELDPRGKP